MLRRLKELRKAADLSQEKLAAKAGLSASTVRKLESGEGTTIETAAKLAVALGVTIGELMGEPEAASA